MHAHTVGVPSAPSLMETQAGYAKIQIRLKFEQLEPARRHFKIRNCRSERLRIYTHTVGIPSAPLLMEIQAGYAKI